MSEPQRIRIGVGQKPHTPDLSMFRQSERQRQEVEVWSRAQFLEEFKLRYGSGQHVTFIGPTQSGKTHLCQDMLVAVVKPQLPCLILAGKPTSRDIRMNQAAERLHLQITSTWPPSTIRKAHRFVRRQTDAPFNGWVLRPTQSMEDLDADDDNMKEEFRKALRDAYAGKYGNIIVVADETKLLYDFGLKKQHEAILTRGAPEIGIWSLLQRGRFVTLYVYDMPEHVLFFHDADANNTRRYAEMVGGISPRHLMDTMDSLERRVINVRETTVSISECIYFCRSDSRLVIVKMD